VRRALSPRELLKSERARTTSTRNISNVAIVETMLIVIMAIIISSPIARQRHSRNATLG